MDDDTNRTQITLTKSIEKCTEKVKSKNFSTERILEYDVVDKQRNHPSRNEEFYQRERKYKNRSN